ncbi:DUF2249 domain-containing protein [Amycolatopsis sp. K13G38]|uniref:DUF2249 domain-containing protein n=1 Tax=Amycolatopsis acididurans TaxID=2724524 RepID=A0ABX1IY57_9PSEU|nr:DUF2249 domain-containing protein [Amycolatopsis acididurans]NKQ52440.1 DUF2249 domain-containing protein [Amycolatopsis acididurans]
MNSASDVYISGTSTDPAVRASIALRGDADRLLLAYQAKAALVTDLALEGDVRQEAHTGLVDFAASRVRPYFAATDRVLYATAAGAPATRLLIRALRRLRDAAHQHLAELAAADNADQAIAPARALGAVLAAVVDLDRNTLLPALAELPGADLPGLAEDLNTLLSGDEPATPDVLDVRPIPHGQRHPRIFRRYARLDPGESFVLVNNHDPKPLRREFSATHPDEFTWEYLESGPEQWHIRIGRSPMPASTPA